MNDFFVVVCFFLHQFCINDLFFFFFLSQFRHEMRHILTLCLTYSAYLSHEEEHTVIGLGVSKRERKQQKSAEAHQMEPPSPIQALGGSPLPSRFSNRTVP